MRGAYIHNFAEMGERSPGAICDTFAAGGMGQVRFKTHQWLSWNGTPKRGGYDTSPYAIRGLGDVRARCDEFRGRGIQPVPWCVPMGLDVEAEAQQAASVARIAGAIDFDVEPYAEFWPGIAEGDYRAVAPFFKRVRDLVGPGVEITLDFPARESAWEWGKVRHAVELAAPYVDRLALQSYFGLDQARDAEARVRALAPGRPVDHIVTPAMLGADLGAYLGGAGATRLLIWLARDMSAAAYERLAGITLAAEGPPAAGEPPAANWQAPGFAALRGRLGARMGAPDGEPWPDGEGNVWQRGGAGVAVWVKAFNRNYWLGLDGTVECV